MNYIVTIITKEALMKNYLALSLMSIIATPLCATFDFNAGFPADPCSDDELLIKRCYDITNTHAADKQKTVKKLTQEPANPQIEERKSIQPLLSTIPAEKQNLISNRRAALERELETIRQNMNDEKNRYEWNSILIYNSNKRRTLCALLGTTGVTAIVFSVVNYKTTEHIQMIDHLNIAI